MARGKQAALAANRRAESAHEIIDRLTSELAEAKLRARLAEAQARRAAELEKEVSHLNSLVAEATSAELEHVRKKLSASVEENRALRSFFCVLIQRWQNGQGAFTDEDLVFIEEAGLSTAFDEVFSNRAIRRVRKRRKSGLIESVTIQDNRRSFKDNVTKADRTGVTVP